jgi:cyclin-dependent kinase
VVTLWYRAPEILLGGRLYSTPVDVWSIGTIFAEMSRGKPLFPGDSEIDQLFRMFRQLGTPNDDSWPGCTTYPDYSAAFPKWPPADLAPACPQVDQLGIDLLTKFLIYEPVGRVLLFSTCSWSASASCVAF